MVGILCGVGVVCFGESRKWLCEWVRPYGCVYVASLNRIDVLLFRG